MSYSKKTIQAILTDINTRKMFLPALQRKFIWERHQIELLFDSLMRNYPFGTFLFWQLSKITASDYAFYEFLTDYDEREPYNRRCPGIFSHEEIIGVLDGQQRLSSMYVGLMGTHTRKAPHKHRTNPNAYEKTHLHLNLLAPAYTITADDKIIENEDRNFEFRFLTQEYAAQHTSRKSAPGAVSDEPMYWLKVGDVLTWGDEPEFDWIVDKMVARSTTQAQKDALQEKRRLAKRCLEILHRRICKDELINYFAVNKNDLDDILKIFVRVNSGGTALGKSDLLFSTIVATWDDGRDRIEKLLQKINQMGDRFNFGNDFLMRCCLVLSDAPIVLKVNSFRPENVQRIRDDWDNIAKAIEATVNLLVEYGFNGELLTSQNATIIIAYYLYKGGDQTIEAKAALRKYLLHALINGVFASSQDQILNAQRNAFRGDPDKAGIHVGRFKTIRFDDFLGIDLPPQCSLKVTEDDLERFLSLRKGAASFFVLALLYPQLRYTDTAFHQDHIHPAAGFTEKNYAAMGIPMSERSNWNERRDLVPNLQLLNDRRNQSKNDMPIAEWISRMTPEMQAAFPPANYFPDSISLDFKDFPKFFEARKETLRQRLRNVLAMTQERGRSYAPEDGRGDDDDAAQDQES